MSPSLVLNRIQCSRHAQGIFAGLQRAGTDLATAENVAQGEDRSRHNTFQESHVRVCGKVPVPVMQPVVQNVERSLSPLETNIDKELERRFVEGSERVLAGEPIADATTAERNVRQQVEQRDGRKTSRRRCRTGGGRLMKSRHMSDDDSQRQAVKSNDLVSLRQLTLTVCPQCKAVCRSGCHGVR